MVRGLSEKLDRVLELLEKVGAADPFKQHKPSWRIVHAKEACTIIGKSLSTLYRAIKVPNAPIPNYERGKLLNFYEDVLFAWIENGRKHAVAPSFEEQVAAVTAGMKRPPRGGCNF